MDLIESKETIKTASGNICITSDWENRVRLDTTGGIDWSRWGKVRLDTTVDLSDIKLTVSGDTYDNFITQLQILLDEYRI